MEQVKDNVKVGMNQTEGSIVRQGFYGTDVDAKRIADPEAASELARIEATQGRDAALAREKELAQGVEKVQLANRKLMDLLLQKYPNAFIERTDDEGHRYLVVNPRAKQQLPGAFYSDIDLVYTEFGPVLVGTNKGKYDTVATMNLEKLSDIAGYYRT